MTSTSYPSGPTDRSRLASTPILHHYWGSPYAEKVRLFLGYKKLAWRSREIAVTPPRPSLAAVAPAHKAGCAAGDASPEFRPDWPHAEDARLGHEVEIVADDYGRTPIIGRVIAMSDRHITIERHSEQTGPVRVHFPRLGYEIVRR